MTYTIEDLRSQGLIIMESRMGSHAYGTSTPASDVDLRGVFVQPLDDVLKYGFVDQISDKTNDVTFYELGRFVDLVIGNNPNIIEMLAVPDDCMILKHPQFKRIESLKPQILTKKVRWTFAGYAVDQIQKARGYNKKMNWEEAQMTRKTVLDFCYVLKDGGSMPFKLWMEYEPLMNTRILKNFATQKNFGLAAIDHGHDLYAMYYNPAPEWGIVSDEEVANEVQLWSIPKGLDHIGYLYFNQEGYTSHCKKYKEYQTWLKERNENRFKMNKEHGKNYDSKNMMHTYRLLLMAQELAEGKLLVRRTDDQIDKLMKIRRGEYEYEDLLAEAEGMITGLDALYAASTLPEHVNKEVVLNTLLDMRRHFYFSEA
jgi:predicted nucleotidyltransferase